MNRKNEYFLELKTKSCFISDFFFNNYNLENFNWLEYFGFDTALLPTAIVDYEPALRELNKTFEIEKLGIIKMNPNTCYLWHTDDTRGVTINMLLNVNHNSLSLFGNFSGQTKKEQVDIVKLEYEQNTFYLYNTQKEHTVLNFNEPRYLFTLEFKKQKEELDYNQIKEFVLLNNL